MKCFGPISQREVNFQTKGMCSRMTFGAMLTSGVAIAIFSALIVVGHYWTVLAVLTQALGPVGLLPVGLSGLGGGGGLAALSPLAFVRVKKPSPPLNIGGPTGFTHVKDPLGGGGTKPEPPKPKPDPIDNDLETDNVENQQQVLTGPEVQNLEKPDEDHELTFSIDLGGPFQIPTDSNSEVPGIDLPPPVPPWDLSRGDPDPKRLEKFTYENFSENNTESIKPFMKRYNDNHFSGNDPWIYYMPKNQEKAAAIPHSPKFHISINRKQMGDAFSVIFPILMKNHLYFKIMAQDRLACGVTEELSRGQNSLGKEFAVYVTHHLESPDWWRAVMEEIEGKLSERKIIPSLGPEGDAPLLHKGFFYTRTPENAFGNYIPAEALKSNFTQLEAGLLSECEWTKYMLGDVDSNVRKKVLIMPESIDGHKAVALVSQITDSNFEDLNLPQRLNTRDTTNSLFMFLAGINMRSNKTPVSALASTLDHALESPDEFNDWFDVGEQRHVEVDNNDPNYWKYSQRKVRETFLREPLAKAARLAAIAHLALELPLDNFGNIMPAVYHHFIVPLAQRKLAGGSFGGKYFDSDVQETKFIKEVAKCTLRERGKQSKSLHPVYKGMDAPELALDRYLDVLLEKGKKFICPDGESV